MIITKNAELFAKNKHAGLVKNDGITKHSQHLEDVVNRLKGLGIIDQDIICAGWLHDIIEDTETIFEELLEQFGNNVAVTVLSLSKDKKLPKKQREKEYCNQLREASIDAKIIKLCDISANLSRIKVSNFSKSRKRRVAKQMRSYFIAIKADIIENNDYPKSKILFDNINETLKILGQRNDKIMNSKRNI